MLEKENNDLIFGLDIGTRTIIGIVGYKQDTEFIVVASEIIEHESRAMVDGQIHDILAVARTAKKVKKRLEGKVGVELKTVAIAAAGRVLKTVKVKVAQEFDQAYTIDTLMINGLELQGIQEAKKQISKRSGESKDSTYFYVGHSVVHYFLNKYSIANLEQQKGEEIGAEILATFLPKVVVDSLYTVMEKIGLEVTNITLEPIAAMNAVIPPHLRLLNLALVDIGAGTSDIAISKEGTVTAYGMIPLAGDEITEKIVHTYLVDFETAENIKQQLASQTSIEFADIIGIGHKIDAKDVQLAIKNTVERLGEEIASKITELNGNKSPNAVFCVGGASQMPYMTEVLAKKLALPIERVTVRSSEHVTGIVDNEKEIKGPESVTPLGICLTTMATTDNHVMSIRVNDETVELLHTKRMTVADAVIAIGMDHQQIISVRGKTLMFKLNNERIRIKGEVGTQPQIMRNGEQATLETPIFQGDELTIKPAQNGQDGKANMTDLIGQCGLEQEEVTIMANGQLVDHTYQVQRGDEITIEAQTDQAKETQEELKSSEEKQLYVTVNDEVVSMPYKKDIIIVTIFDYIDFDLSTPQGNIVLKLNGDRASYTDVLQDGDQIEIYWDKDKL